MAKPRLPMLQAPADRRLLLALAASLLLHGALLNMSVPGSVPHAPAAPLLHALLLPQPEAQMPLPALLHDTLGEEAPLAAVPPAPAAPRAAIEPATPRDAKPAPEVRAAAPIAEHLLYPPEAVAAGIEGEVRVRITLDAAGAIADASIARGSGHPVLDAAALRATRAIVRLPGAPPGEALLPVVFRLR